jgi:hypothetical protein
LSWLRLAECVEAAGAIALWIPAYKASRMKLARAAVTINPNNNSQFSQLKTWWIKRQENRERKWTERDHVLLWFGFVLLVSSSAIKIFLG